MTVVDDLAPLQVLTPVDLDDVDAAAELQTRKDRKYLVPRHIVTGLLTALDGEWQVLTIAGARNFRYESVYFDTEGLASYLGAARRRPHRFKVRTRSYLDSATCMLEVKTRDARGRTVKHRFPHDFAQRAQLTDDAKRFIATIDQAVEAVDELRPNLTTTYRRATLVHADSAARVTVDLDVAWARPDECHTTLGDALVETKTPGQPCAFDRTLWRSGYRPVTISKYCTGLAALCPRLPSNKWHRVLREHFNEVSTAGG